VWVVWEKEEMDGGLQVVDCRYIAGKGKERLTERASCARRSILAMVLKRTRHEGQVFSFFAQECTQSKQNWCFCAAPGGWQKRGKRST
jgi:hypothetical protein